MLKKETCDFITQTSAISWKVGVDPSNKKSLWLLGVSIVDSLSYKDVNEDKSNGDTFSYSGA